MIFLKIKFYRKFEQMKLTNAAEDFTMFIIFCNEVGRALCTCREGLSLPSSDNARTQTSELPSIN